MSIGTVLVIAYILIAMAAFLALIDTNQKYYRLRDLVSDVFIMVFVSITWFVWPIAAVLFVVIMGFLNMRYIE